jgi:hypothetical protein
MHIHPLNEQEFAALTQGAEVIESDGHGLMVLRLADVLQEATVRQTQDLEAVAIAFDDLRALRERGELLFIQRVNVHLCSLSSNSMALPVASMRSIVALGEDAG